MSTKSQCLNCNKKTSNPKFCGRSCSATYNNKKHPKRKPQGKCSVCETPVPTQRTFCDPCFKIRKRKNRTKIIPGLKCILCGKTYTYDYKRKNHTKTKCNSCLANKHKESKRNKIHEYMGKVCMECGFKGEIIQFDCHHRNPLNKSFTISGSFCRKWDVLQEELNKCDYLCANCHRLK